MSLLVDTGVFYAHHDEDFEEYADQSLSFTDATTVATADVHSIDYVLSFDDDFDGVVECLDPSSV